MRNLIRAMRLALLALSVAFVVQAQQTDWKHIDLKLFINVSARQIEGVAKWRIGNLSDTLVLNLSSGLTIDSVIYANQHCQYGRQTPDLVWISCSWNNTLDSFAIYYSGSPATDPSGWGGFYFTNSYAYNIGVGFAVKPHSFGRAWFPCPDTVAEKFTVSIEAHVPNGWIALASGEPDTFPSLDSIWKYSLNIPIPAYLVSIVAAPYHIILDTFNTLNGPKPVMIAALPQDTAKARASFRNLNKIHRLWEHYFGQDIFPRIGFNLVPFTGGAMEHPTNISYSRFLVDGTLQYEYIIAHELSHHWFGDNITASTERHMWINEGFASYAEHLWLEHNGDGWNWQETLDELMRTAHIKDGEWIRLDSIPHKATYGVHAYEKGALIVHTLRLWINGNEDTSDALVSFGNRLRFLFENYSLQALTSKQLISILTGPVPTDTSTVPPGFYEIYITRNGYPTLWLDSWNCDGSTCTATIYRARYGPDQPAQIPMPVYIYALDESGSVLHRKKVFVLPGCNKVVFSLSTQPTFLTLNLEQSTLDASVRTISDTSIQWTPGHITVKTSGSKPYLVTHHFTSPGTAYPLPSGIQLSPNHFWTIQDPNNTIDSITFTFNSRSTGSSAYLDWIVPSDERALQVFWRPTASAPWQQIPANVNTMGSQTDGFATLSVKNPGTGHFVIGLSGNVVDTITPVLQNTCNIINSIPEFIVNNVIRMIGNELFIVTDFVYGAFITTDGKIIQTFSQSPIAIPPNYQILHLLTKLPDGQVIYQKILQQ
ncbi:MAG: M1 family metallopeptidase [Chlorobi bacterium]|nr:M1 family metallopeptidase [Chlorobiota bacterium]